MRLVKPLGINLIAVPYINKQIFHCNQYMYIYIYYKFNLYQDLYQDKTSIN